MSSVNPLTHRYFFELSFYWLCCKYETCPIRCIFSRHCGYWWAEVSSPGHQQPRCGVRSHAFPGVYGLRGPGYDGVDELIWFEEIVILYALFITHPPPPPLFFLKYLNTKLSIINLMQSTLCTKNRRFDSDTFGNKQGIPDIMCGVMLLYKFYKIFIIT